MSHCRAISTLGFVALLANGCGGGGGGSTGTTGTGGGLLIRGPVTGLVGTGLIVANGGATQEIPAGGSIFFFQNVPKGSTYNVTIQAQPTQPWQTCVVSNGSGTAQADVTSASIACTTNAYAVRGTVSGLTGSGLSLLINGGGAVSVAPGTTTFAFNPLASGTHFDVTIGTQPAGQTCVVSGGSATIAGGDITTTVVTCGAPGFTVGGTAIVAVSGLELTLNGTTRLAIPVDATTFTFPTVLQSGTDWGVTITAMPSAPRMACVLTRGKGRIAAASFAGVGVQCYSAATLAPVSGTYSLVQNNRKQYLTLWNDGTYTFASRIDDATCTNSGNGIEVGAYQRQASGTFLFRSANTDTNGGCGVYAPGAPGTPGTGLGGILTRTGNALALAATDGTAYNLTAVANDTTSLVGAFSRADGQDGSVVVFEPDGTYLFVESQDGQGNGNPAGYELGCYAVSGGTFTVNLSGTCRPQNLPAIDANGRSGFSGVAGAIPFTINSGSRVTINGVTYNRITPGG